MLPEAFHTAQILLTLTRGWLLVGLAVAVVFVAWGADRVEPNARGAWAFRPLLVPGVVLIWPLVLLRWWRLARGWDEARRHRPPRRVQGTVALVLILAIPAIIAVSLAVRQNGPFERPPVRLESPEGR